VNFNKIAYFWKIDSSNIDFEKIFFVKDLDIEIQALQKVSAIY
jgi:hypothetical protein